MGSKASNPLSVSFSRIAVAGATGYSGQELVKLLAAHPSFELKARIGREDDLASLKGQVDLAFLCTPNEVSLEMAPLLLAQGISVIDLSGAFRLKKHSYPEWYGFEHSSAEWLAKSEYGLHPWRTLRPFDGTPRLIANPGCYATAVAMTLLPLLKAGLIDPTSLFVDAKSGVSGAGRKAALNLLFTEISGEFAPYRTGKHQHWPEIVETLEFFGASGAAGEGPVFVTELLPVERGISVAVFANWAASLAPGARGTESLVAAYAKAYEGAPDISYGSDGALASMKAVQRTNRFHVQANVAFGKPVLFGVIDNLLRGAAGQALSNANQLAGLGPFEGLPL